MSRTSCVQSSRLLPWCKRQDEFATAWQPCKSLSGQVHPMQTQCTHTTCQCLWFDVDTRLLASRTILYSPLNTSLDCPVTTDQSTGRIKFYVTAFSNLTVHEPDEPAYCLAEKLRRANARWQGKGRTLTAVFSKLCESLPERQRFTFLDRNNVY